MDHERRGIGSERRLLADDVFRRIADEIVIEKLCDGRVLRDHELARRLNVSRTPVREALMRLERIGLVEIEPSRFTRVTAVDAATIDHHRELAGYMAGVAAHMAVPRLTEAELLHTLGLVDAVSGALEDPLAASRARHELFHFLSRHSGNPAHHALMADAEIALTRALGRMPLRPISVVAQRAECAALRTAILTRDAETVERLIRVQHGILKAPSDR